MDLFEFDHMKADKSSAMNRYRGVQKMAKLFRLFELFLALGFLSWFSTRLPFVFQISGNYFKQICLILVSPRFVFFLGNAIVLTLFAKSGHFSGKNNAGSYLYQEFLKNSSGQRVPSPTDQLEVVFQEKQTTVTEEKCTQPLPLPCREKHQHVAIQKKISRSQSENVKRMVSEKPLQRSVTVEKCRRDEKADQEAAAVREENGEEEEDISNEEFQRRIEEFIAKQLRFHKEESMAIVLF